jgi:ubiquinone/menaquinone biosynthesis C-methylase UbiE
MHPLAVLLACPACHRDFDGPGACGACGRRVRIVDGWCVDAVDDVDISEEHRRRLRGFDQRWSPLIYDLDVRVTSRAIWGVSFSTQVDFNAKALECAVDLGLPYLDVAAGTGLMLQNALRRNNRPPMTAVVDLSMEMLGRAHRRLGDGALYVRASVDALPFRTGAFGVVHCANGLHLFPSTSAACGEMTRVIGPGGSMFATTWTDQGNAIARSYQRFLRHFGSINEPQPAPEYATVLEASGMTPEVQRQAGNLLMWTGSKASAAG